MKTNIHVTTESHTSVEIDAILNEYSENSTMLGFAIANYGEGDIVESWRNLVRETRSRAEARMSAAEKELRKFHELGLDPAEIVSLLDAERFLRMRNDDLERQRTQEQDRSDAAIDEAFDYMERALTAEAKLAKSNLLIQQLAEENERLRTGKTGRPATGRKGVKVIVRPRS